MVHCKKKVSDFPVSSHELTKLSMEGNNLIIPGQGEFGKWHPAGDGKIANLFLQCKAKKCWVKFPVKKA